MLFCGNQYVTSRADAIFGGCLSFFPSFLMHSLNNRRSYLKPVVLLFAGLTVICALGYSLLGKRPTVPTADGVFVLETADSKNRSQAGPSVKLSQILEADDPSNKPRDLAILAQSMAKEDLRTALALRTEIPDRKDRVAYLVSLIDAQESGGKQQAMLEAWASLDPLEAAHFVAKSWNGGSGKESGLRAVMQVWAKADPYAAAGWIEKNATGVLKLEAYESLLEAWAALDAPASANWLLQTEQREERLYAVVARVWGTTTPEDAGEWIENLNSKRLLAAARKALMQTWARQDLPAMVAYYKPALEHSCKRHGPNLASCLAECWAGVDLEAATVWAQGLPTEALQSAAIQGVVSLQLNQGSMAAAVEWSSRLEPACRRQAVLHLAKAWVVSEPEKALAWLEALPAEICRDSGEEAYKIWARTNSASLTQWIQQRSVGDLAKAALAESVFAAKPSEALGLILEVADAKHQIAGFGKLFKKWSHSEAGAAEAWLESHNGKLTPKHRAAAGLE
jgi:hypothetical protein